MLIAAQGMFNEPSRPAIPGLDDFAGPAFHTARWNHACDLQGASVGLIGSAASAVQCAPEIAREASRMVMFQRTPNWVLPKQDRPYTPDKLAYLKTAPDVVEQRRARLWTEFDGFALIDDPKRHRESVALGLANIAVVTDPVVRAKLTPTYSFGCKRDPVHDRMPDRVHPAAAGADGARTVGLDGGARRGHGGLLNGCS